MDSVLVVSVWDGGAQPLTDTICSLSPATTGVQLVVSPASLAEVGLSSGASGTSVSRLSSGIAANASGYVTFPKFGLQLATFEPGATVFVRVACRRTSGAGVDGPAPVDVAKNVTEKLGHRWCRLPPVTGLSQEALPTFSVSISTLPVSTESCSAAAAGLPAVQEDSARVPPPALPSVSCSAALLNGTAASGMPVDMRTAFVSGSLALVNPNDGTATFSDLVLTAQHGATYLFSVSCSIGAVALPSPLQFVVQLRGCTAGQQPVGIFCQKCPIDSYSRGGEGDGSLCVPCPPHGCDCTDGLLRPLENFFRPPSFSGKRIDNATELHACLNGEACLVNTTDLTWTCAVGYTGALCGVCEAPGFVQSTGGFCIPCEHNDIAAVRLAAIVCAVVAGLVFLAFRRTDDSNRGEDRVVLRILTSYLQALGALRAFKAGGTRAYRELMGFTEVVSASPLGIGSLQCIVRPSFITQYTINVALPILGTAAVLLLLLAAAVAKRPRQAWTACTRSIAGLGAGCCATRHCWRRRPRAVARLTTSPSVVWTSGEETERPISRQPAPLIAGQFSLREEIATVRKNGKHVSSLVFLSFLLYMSVTTASLRALHCTDAIDGVQYLLADLRVACWQGDHSIARVVAYLTLIGFSLGFPVALFVVVARSTRSQLMHRQMRDALGFLYDGYRSGGMLEGNTRDVNESGRSNTCASAVSRAPCCGPVLNAVACCRRHVLRVHGHIMWWESLILLRKAGVVVLAVLVTNPFLQSAGAALWLGAFLMLHVTVQPYENWWLNAAETLSLSAGAATAIISSALLEHDLSDPAVSGRPAAAMTTTEWAITGSMAVINISVLVTLGIAAAVVKVRRTAQQVKAAAMIIRRQGIGLLGRKRGQDVHPVHAAGETRSAESCGAALCTEDSGASEAHTPVAAAVEGCNQDASRGVLNVAGATAFDRFQLEPAVCGAGGPITTRSPLYAARSQHSPCDRIMRQAESSITA